MTLRTPRRRISPQARRRYRAIKGFFQRALGSSSQQHLQITSSIAVNVTELKHKIVGLEKQLNEVNKHYRAITSIENSSREESQSCMHTELTDINQEEIPPDCETQFKEVKTKTIYKTSLEQYKKLDGSDSAGDSNNETSKVKSNNNNMNEFYTDHTKTKKKKSKLDIRANDMDMDRNLRKHRTRSEHQHFGSVYATSSLHSFARFKENIYSNPECSGYGEYKRNDVHVPDDHYKVTISRDQKKPNFGSYDRYPEVLENKRAKSRKPKRTLRELDQDFIADIIRRQYKPVSMFGRRESDFSQFSAPVCRDREFCFTANNRTIENPKVCECCYGGRHYRRPAHHSDHSDMRSVCDARLYNINVKPRVKKHRKHEVVYDDSDIYDLVPVKEKSSPKSRRKFPEYNMPAPAYYKEVPPSPRSQRPRLNLKAQYYTNPDNDNVNFVRKRVSPKTARKQRVFEELEENCNQTETRQMKNLRRTRNLNKRHDLYNMQRMNNGDEMGTMSSLQYAAFKTEENIGPTETLLNKTQGTVSSADKTDKALCEIKDILQNFLQEIKKEASSHSGKSEVTSQMNVNCSSLNDVKVLPNSGQTFNNYNPPQCQLVAPSYVPAFANTCCYPIMPLCPMNCMQNSIAMSNTSLTCNHQCAPKSSETCHNKNVTKTSEVNDTLNDETDELIKQIYEFVSKSPTFSRKHNSRHESNERKADATETRLLTSRSAGGSTVSRHDVKVGTAKLRCVSKSCEAIHSRLITDTSSGDTNATCSDTVLEKISIEPTTTHSYSETGLSTEVSEVDKAKRNKFAKVLKSLGLKKAEKNKYKRDVIEELSESESMINVEVNNRKPPFRQNVTSYVMHGQEYCRPPPVSPHYRPDNPHVYRPPFNTEEPFYNPRMQQPMNELYHSGPHQYPTAPPYSQSYDSYNPMQPQLPLCLKEIEVKSIGCQSERKMSFFRKITQKMQQPTETICSDDIQKNCSTQTAQNKPKLFNWKNPQQQPMAGRINPYAYGYKTQKKLAEGDMKMRNAMLKKMFYKRNPFSPRNLIIRTLMGKDKSSFGDPPAMYRPRMFI